MKALIAAGGRATRLRPITTTINKHLIPLAVKPMIFYAIENIAGAGITEIAINVNPGEQELQKSVGDGSRWGVHITYIEQQGGPRGVAHVIGQARHFLGDSPFVFYLGDNILMGGIKRFINKFEQEKLHGLITLARVPDPQRFGVPVFENGKIIRVEEKPNDPKSNYAVSGIYVYDSNVFKAVDAIQPSTRGEYEISDVHTWLIQHGYNIGWEEITGWWKDTGKPEDLLEGNMLVLSLLTSSDRENLGTIDSTVTIHGNVKIGKGTVITGKTLIRGPVVIGENCVINDSYIGPYTSINHNVVLEHAQVEHSIICDNAFVNTGCRINDSIVGIHAKIMSADATFPSGHRLVVGDHAVVEL